MSQPATLYRAARPAPTPERCLLVAPASVDTLDGGPRSPGLCVRGGDPPHLRTVPATSPQMLGEMLADRVGRHTTAVWLGARDRLTRSLGGPPVRIERAIRTTARDQEISMCGFTGRRRRATRSHFVYDEVLDGGPVSTRQPSSRE